jgi:hypothetical protein
MLSSRATRTGWKDCIPSLGRIAEHTFRCDCDIVAMARAGSLIASGQTAEVRTRTDWLGLCGHDSGRDAF